MATPRQNDSRIAEQAAQWLSTVEDGGPAERAAFAAWLKESPRHVGEVLTVKAMCDEFAGLELSHLLHTNDALSDANNVVPLRAEVAIVRERRRRRWATAAAIAAISIAMAAAGLWFGERDRKSYTTEVGEQRGFELADGSLVHLNTQSQVKVHFSETAREIELTSGEALFDVARNPSRPFRVHAGAAVIEAIGTQFNVYRRAQRTTVSVIEGAVHIQGEKVLTSGEQADVGPDGRIAHLAPVDPEKAAAWRERRLEFVEERLDDIVAEFNRYNRAPKFRVEGKPLGERQLTGVFDTNAPESFIRFLDGVDDLTVVRNHHEVVIRQREDR